MYACVCQAVPVADVELAVVAGAADLEQIGEATYAGTACQTCHETLEGIIDRVGCPMAALHRSA